MLANRPQGFPWLRVAGRELTGITVVDLDASIVFAASDKENAAPTYQGGIGFCPNLATGDNTEDMLAIDPRPPAVPPTPVTLRHRSVSRTVPSPGSPAQHVRTSRRGSISSPRTTRTALRVRRCWPWAGPSRPSSICGGR
ncbi:MAG: hypothetical protein LC808_37370 [Actinobacteria bacterium]|nr:hypothetical protein [Actinomycetota bacterium]